MTLRLHGTREEVTQATRRLVQVLEVVAVSQPYSDRGASVLVRVYLEVRLGPAGGAKPAAITSEEATAVRVTLLARLGGNQQSGLEVDRTYAVHAGPDLDGRVLVFDDHTHSFRPLGPAEYREVPDPLEPHDLVRIDQDQGGYRAVCTCVWRPWKPAADPDEAAHLHRAHLWHMDLQERLLTMAVHPLLLEWVNDLRARQRRQEPQR